MTNRDGVGAEIVVLLPSIHHVNVGRIRGNDMMKAMLLPIVLDPDFICA